MEHVFSLSKKEIGLVKVRVPDIDHEEFTDYQAILLFLKKVFVNLIF